MILPVVVVGPVVVGPVVVVGLLIGRITSLITFLKSFVFF